MKLKAENCSFAYPSGRQILKDISFETDRGHILAVLGANGAGKTTLLRCLLGFMKWTSGTVYYDDVPSEKADRKEFRKKAAYVPQAKTMTFPYETQETVLLGRTPYLSLFSGPSKKDMMIAEEAMKDCGIMHLAGRKCSEISGGELQLVLIARALAQQPELLIMDEPETGLDFRNQLAVLNLTEKLCHEKNLTVIFNTHYPEHALRIADQTLLITGEDTCLYGDTEKILTDENMRKAFGVDIIRFNETVDGKRYSAVIPVPLQKEEPHDQR